MAAESNVLTRSYPIADSADLSGDQYKFVVLSSGNTVVAGANALALGVLQNKPKDGGTAGRSASVMLYGTTRVITGAAVSEGAAVNSDASGTAVAATTGQNPSGIALQAAAGAGEIIEILLTPGGQAA